MAVKILLDFVRLYGYIYIVSGRETKSNPAAKEEITMNSTAIYITNFLSGDPRQYARMTDAEAKAFFGSWIAARLRRIAEEDMAELGRS